jgi:F-type H+-transporting ATPase subunit gamma
VAKPREIKRKIGTVEGTRKITSTMETLAKVRSKQNQNRLRGAVPYRQGLEALVADLVRGGEVEHPLVRQAPAERSVAVVIVTSNRGLCGGFNSQILRAAEDLRAKLVAEGKEVSCFVIGKRGLSRFRFLRLTAAWSTAAFDDRPSFAGAAELADRLMADFAAEALDRVVVVSSRYLSASEQRVRETPLLPIAPEAAKNAKPDFLFEGGEADVVDRLLPAAVRSRLFGLLLESAASEQAARRIAMKAATDAADDMIKAYKRLYYRARQGAITLELMDVIGGANAVSGEGS